MAASAISAMAIAGCTGTPRTQIGGAVPSGPEPAVSWDGTYRGSVQITGTGSGAQRQWCETTTQIVFQVASNAFSYAMPHPNAPDNRTPVYAATIASDGTFKSTLNSGTMTGRATGSHISGVIEGSICNYSFALDRS